MSQNHELALKTRHQELEQALHEELKRPYPDAVRVRELKKLKLSIKEQLFAAAASVA